MNLPEVVVFNAKPLTHPFTASDIVLMLVLYAATFGCFGGAIALLLRAVRGLTESNL